MDPGPIDEFVERFELHKPIQIEIRPAYGPTIGGDQAVARMKRHSHVGTPKDLVVIRGLVGGPLQIRVIRSNKAQAVSAGSATRARRSLAGC
jgi:hypothetical protein